MRWFNQQPKRNFMQEEALKAALEIYNSDPEKYKDTMFCPYCGSPLIKSGEQRRMETLSEHVTCSEPSLKDEYVCSAIGKSPKDYIHAQDIKEMNEKIKATEDGVRPYGCTIGCLHSWNGDNFGIEKGGNYCSTYKRHLYDLMDAFPEDKELTKVIKEYFNIDYGMEHGAALNTFECEQQTSTYKVGLPKMKRLPAWLTFNKIQLTINYSYKADDFGRVIKTWIHLGFMKKDDHLGGGFSTYGTFPWHTWNYLQRCARRRWKVFKTATTERQRNIDLLEYFEKSNNDAWIYKFHHWYLKNIKHPIVARKVLKYFELKEFMTRFKTSDFLEDWIRNHHKSNLSMSNIIYCKDCKLSKNKSVDIAGTFTCDKQGQNQFLDTKKICPDYKERFCSKLKRLFKSK